MEELVAGIVGAICRALVLTPLGFAYLHLRYGKQNQWRQVLTKKYQNSYSNAGEALVESAIRAVLVLALIPMVVLLIGLPLFVFWSALQNWLHK